MALWLFNLVIPAIMIVFGAYFTKRSPNKINMLLGYRTALSMKNRDTWETAHSIIGKCWLTEGVILLLASAIPAILYPESEIALIIVMFAQLPVLLSGVIYTEIRLHRIFDKNGNRMGFGEGYYDRFLADFKGTKIGIGYKFQCENNIIADEYDIAMNYVINEEDIYVI